MIQSAETAALEAIARISEHNAFACAALPANEESMSYIGKEFCEVLDIALEALGRQPKKWAVV